MLINGSGVLLEKSILLKTENKQSVVKSVAIAEAIPTLATSLPFPFSFLIPQFNGFSFSLPAINPFTQTCCSSCCLHG